MALPLLSLCARLSVTAFGSQSMKKNEKSHSYSCSFEDCCDLVARTGHQNDAIAYALDDSSVYSQDHFNIVILVVLDLARDLIDQDRAGLLGFGSTGQKCSCFSFVIPPIGIDLGFIWFASQRVL